jgi:hypothetical protein
MTSETILTKFLAVLRGHGHAVRGVHVAEQVSVTVDGFTSGAVLVPSRFQGLLHLALLFSGCFGRLS